MICNIETQRVYARFRNTQNALQYSCFKTAIFSCNIKHKHILSFRTSQMHLVRATLPCSAAMLMIKQTGILVRMIVFSMGSSSLHRQGTKFLLLDIENLSQDWKKKVVRKPLLLTRWTPLVVA